MKKSYATILSILLAAVAFRCDRYEPEPPVITELSADPAEVPADGETTVFCNGEDDATPFNRLIYQLTITSGSGRAGIDDQHVVVSPIDGNPVSVRCSVTDEDGLSASQEITVPVAGQ